MIFYRVLSFLLVFAKEVCDGHLPVIQWSGSVDIQGPVMAELTEQQRIAVELAICGHNLIITGQCGTGNTHLLR